MKTAPISDQFHPDLVRAVMEQATVEADGVALVLKEWSIRTPSASGEPFVLEEWPKSVLLSLALILRFKSWEINGICFHKEAGLPRSDELFDRVLQLESVEDRRALLEKLQIDSLKLFCDHFVWIAKAEYQVDLGFKNVLNDDHLDAIADFLWNNRHAFQLGETE